MIYFTEYLNYRKYININILKINKNNKDNKYQLNKVIVILFFINIYIYT